MSNVYEIAAKDISGFAPGGGPATLISLRKWRAHRDSHQPLGDLDWKVVEMARADGPRSVNPEGFLARLTAILGLPVARPLTNESLEALRRFSVRAWYWDLVRNRDVHALFAAGYSRTHVREILAHVASVRGFTPSLQDDFDSLASLKRRRGSSDCRCG